jgi:hypothetical protein
MLLSKRHVGVADCGEHELGNDPAEREAGGGDAEYEGAGVAGVEAVTLFERFLFRVRSVAVGNIPDSSVDDVRVEQAVRDVERPDSQGEGERRVERQGAVRGCCEKPCPDGGHDGRIEAGEVYQHGQPQESCEQRARLDRGLNWSCGDRRY